MMAEKVTLQEMQRVFGDMSVEKCKEGFMRLTTFRAEQPDIYLIFPEKMPLDNEGRISAYAVQGIEDKESRLEELGINRSWFCAVPRVMFGKFEELDGEKRFLVAVTADEVLQGEDMLVMACSWSKYFASPKYREVIAHEYRKRELACEATLKDYLDNLEAVKAAMAQLAPRVMSLTTPEAQWNLQLNKHSADLVVVYDGWKFYIEFPYNGIYVELLQKIVTEAWVRQGWKAHMQHMFGSFTSGWTAVDLEAPELKLRWFAEWIG